MNETDAPTLEVGFAIETGSSFDELLRLQQIMNFTEGKVVAEAAKIERATGGMVNLAGATAQMSAFGNAATRELENVRRANAAAEKSGEAMARQLTRQIETFGKTTSEIRAMRAEQRALAAESRGYTELAARIRGASAEMDRLEQGARRVPGVSNAARHSMQNLGFQVQDFAVQVIGGTSALKAFAMQAPQAAGALNGFGGSLGKVGTFLASGWGAAATLAITLGAGLADKWLDGASAAQKKTDAAKELTDAINALSDSTRQQIATEYDAQRATLASAFALRQKALDARTATMEELANARAKLASALAESARPDPSRGQDGGIDFALARAGQLDAKIKEIDARLVKQQAELGKTEVAFRNAQAGFLGAEINANLDRAAGLTRDYERQLSALNQQFTRTGDVRTYARARALLEAGYAREKDALDKSNDRKLTATDRSAAHAEQLGREANAIGAQIANLYQLADAYGVSNAAALIAEAKVKAETAAIRARGDINAAVEREVQLAIAQRVADAAKVTAGLRDQIAAQRIANEAVSAGLLPAERAADLVKDQITDLPFLAAIQVAQQRGLADEAKRATAALEGQRKAREELRTEEASTRFNTAWAAGENRLAELQEELRLVGAADDIRQRALATLKATREAELMPSADRERYLAQQREIADLTAKIGADQRAYNDALTFAADRWDLIARNVSDAARGMADAFGGAGRAIGGMVSIFADFHANRERLELEHAQRLAAANKNEEMLARATARFKLATATAQIGAFGDMTDAARGFFSEGSSGYAALTKAMQVFRAVEFALSVRAMAQDAALTATAVVNGAVRIAKLAAEGIAAQAKLPFPLNIAAMGATAAALAAIGASVAGAFGGGGKNTLEPPNSGTGTVFGDPKAQSESIRRAIDQLKEVDTTMLTYSREMAASLRSIDNQIGGFAAVILRSGDVNASEGVAQGFKPNAIGSVLGAIPLVGGLLKSLFGTTTSVIGSGLYGGPQSLASILSGGFDGSSYSDIERKSKFLGITTSKKYSTQFGALDPALEGQFTLILRSFYDAISAAAGPLGVATSDIQQRLNSFVVSIGKIDLKGLTGEQMSEKLSAVFGAAADQMAAAAFPGFQRFQQAGEGMFETLVRVASTVETVSTSLDQLGFGARALSIDAKLGIADQFDSLSALTGATDNYFKAYYTREEQAAASAAQFAKVFQGLGLSMPSSLSAFRALVEAQDLVTAAGQATYATLLQLAPAFAELQNALAGAKSAADVIAERQDLERKLLELQGNTAALRALDLAKLDASNRALQQQIWALQDAQEAARAADELRKAWTSVGDSIMDEVRRIRGLSVIGGDGSFASLMGQFNAAAAAAPRDLEAAKKLPGLSQAMLAAAEKAATSRQELDRIRAQTASTLESLAAAINGANPSTGETPAAALLQNMADVVSIAAAANDSTATELRTGIAGLREELAQVRTAINTGNATIASNTGGIKRHLDNVTAASGGDAIAVVNAA